MDDTNSEPGMHLYNGQGTHFLLFEGSFFKGVWDFPGVKWLRLPSSNARGVEFDSWSKGTKRSIIQPKVNK